MEEKYIIKERNFHNTNKHAIQIFVDCVIRSGPGECGVDIYEYNRDNKITGLFKILPGETKKFNFMLVNPKLESLYSQYNLTFFGEQEPDYYVQFLQSCYIPSSLINCSESTENVINTLFK